MDRITAHVMLAGGKRLTRAAVLRAILDGVKLSGAKLDQMTGADALRDLVAAKLQK